MATKRNSGQNKKPAKNVQPPSPPAKGPYPRGGRPSLGTKVSAKKK